FEKDFWETEDDVELDSVLQILRVGGHYSTNSSLGGVSAALHMMGLESVGEYDINGSQYLYRRRTATMLDWRRLRTALAASIRVFQELMIDDANVLCFGSGAAPARGIHELLESSPAILAPFA